MSLKFHVGFVSLLLVIFLSWSQVHSQEELGSILSSVGDNLQDLSTYLEKSDCQPDINPRKIGKSIGRTIREIAKLKDSNPNQLPDALDRCWGLTIALGVLALLCLIGNILTTIMIKNANFNQHAMVPTESGIPLTEPNDKTNDT